MEEYLEDEENKTSLSWLYINGEMFPIIYVLVFFGFALILCCEKVIFSSGLFCPWRYMLPTLYFVLYVSCCVLRPCFLSYLLPSFVLLCSACPTDDVSGDPSAYRVEATETMHFHAIADEENVGSSQDAHNSFVSDHPEAAPQQPPKDQTTPGLLAKTSPLLVGRQYSEAASQLDETEGAQAS